MKSDTSTEALSDIKIKEHQRKLLDQIDLSGLNPNQMQMAEQMLIQEAAAFSVGDSNVGNVTSTCMDIKLYDNTPFYAEFKAQIGDLNKQGLNYQPNISLVISGSIG